MDIKVGDKVIVNTERHHREHGTVVERLCGETTSTTIYKVVLNNGETLWARNGQVELLEEDPATFTFDITIPDGNDIVIVKMMEDGKEIGRGHGHVIHHGALGIAQAASYAFKRIWNDLTDKEEGERF